MRSDLKTKGSKKTERARKNRRDSYKPVDVEVKIRNMKRDKIQRLRRKLGDLTSPELSAWLQPKIERNAVIAAGATAVAEAKSSVAEAKIGGAVNSENRVLIDTIMAGVTRIGDDMNSRMELIEKRLASMEENGLNRGHRLDQLK
jgi:hypothetical protein